MYMASRQNKELSFVNAAFREFSTLVTEQGIHTIIMALSNSSKKNTLEEIELRLATAPSASAVAFRISPFSTFLLCDP
jgi:hypothetical protein